MGCVFFHVDGFGFVAVGGGFSAVFVWICALSWVKVCCSRWGFWGVFFHVDGFGFVAVGGGFSAVFVWICALSWAKFCCSSGGNRLCFLTIRLGLIGDSGKRKNGWY